MSISEKNTVTAGRLRELLRYDPQTGSFVWRARSSFGSHIRIGEIAGYTHHSGYRHIAIDRRCYPAHRLAFLYMTGQWPEHEIDHRNLDKADNRWENLREATRGQNSRNTPLRKDNQLGIKGVSIWGFYL